MRAGSVLGTAESELLRALNASQETYLIRDNCLLIVGGDFSDISDIGDISDISITGDISDICDMILVMK